MRKSKILILFSLLAVGLIGCKVNNESSSLPNSVPPSEISTLPSTSSVTPVTSNSTVAHVHDLEWKSEEDGHYQACKTCDYVTSKQAHAGGSATCQAKAICDTCKGAYGELGNHTLGDWTSKDATNHHKVCSTTGCTHEITEAHTLEWKEDADHKHYQKCSVCGYETEHVAHSGGSATCQAKAVCETCNTAYGNLGDHVLSEWASVDGTNHKKVCTTTGCNHEVVEAHTLEWKEDADHKHYQECSVCGFKTEAAPHSGGNATCQAKAICEVCGKAYGDLGDHTLNDWTNKDATNHHKVCQIEGCDHEVVDAHNLEWKTTTDGKHYQECSVCSYTSVQEVHNLEWKEDADHKHYQECSVCGYETEHVAHSGGSATCTTKAVCEVCNTPYGELLEHELSTTWTSKDENNHVKKCANCDYELVEKHTLTSKINESTHDSACKDCDYVATQEAHKGGTATCQELAHCEVCNTPYGELGDHVLSEWTSVDGTNHKKVCTTTGCDHEVVEAHTLEWKEDSDHKHYQECSVCGYETEHVAHSGGSATCQAKAICEVCGKAYGDLGDHTFTNWVSVDETTHKKACTIEGCSEVITSNHEYEWKEDSDHKHYQECSVCNHETDHEEHTLEWKEDADHKHYQECSVCNHETDHEEHTLEWKEDENHKHYQECSVCGYETEHVVHTYSTWTSIDDDTHTATCSVCNHVETVAHEYEWKEDADHKHYQVCDVCEHETAHESHAFTCNTVLKDKDNKVLNLFADVSCEHGTRYYKTCECGLVHSESEDELFEVGDPLGHADLVHVEAILTFAYDIQDHYECSRCGQSFNKVDEEYVKITFEDAYHDGQAAHVIAGNTLGYGTEENPFIISSFYDLQLMEKYIAEVEVEIQDVDSDNNPKVDDEGNPVMITKRVAVEQYNLFKSSYFKLVNDITLKENEYFVIAYGDTCPFMGTFDGNNKIIENYKYISSNSVALFSRAVNATIKDLTMSNINISVSGQRAAAIVARAENVTVTNCHVDGEIMGGAKDTSGGIIAYGIGTINITDCSADITFDVTGSDKVRLGAILGNSTNGKQLNDGTTTVTTTTIITRCDAKLTLSGSVDTWTGGIVGLITSGTLNIVDSIAEVNITQTNSAQNGLGGALGYVNGGKVTLNNVTTSGTISGAASGIGGMIGYIKSTSKTIVKNSSSSVELTGSNNGLGGILGYANGTSSVIEITNCHTTGNITMNGSALVGQGTGGIVGCTGINTKSIAISNCSASGTITSNIYGVGGIVGSYGLRTSATSAALSSGETEAVTSLTISGCEFKGTVTASTLGAGGIIGDIARNKSAITLTIDNCSTNSTATITSSAEGAGGIVGYRLAGPLIITNCINNAAINGAGNGTGGIIGGSTANKNFVITISNCRNYGAITGGSYTGGIGGLIRLSTDASKVENCYNFGNVTGGANTSGILGVARIAIENCYCYSEAIIKVSNTSKAAKDYTDTTYIAKSISTKASDGIGSITNCNLINEMINPTDPLPSSEE